MIYSYTIAELAIALAYIVLDASDPLGSVQQVFKGYVFESPLNDEELESVWWLMIMRLCMSLCLAAHQQRKIENDYLDINQQSIRRNARSAGNRSQ